ncbi:MAG: D-alanyl-D-alanine carboxypeptidase/D-alanyl-D-alanine-endopeptidase [Planctomyces sp.]|nr:D-alanyl-D-alanine carboxypeptidase/D-alanyl-D-alanine-endopeptidase [Planctomyces sp.]MBA4039658.1 D-alanyl-D-alanine carboxypeptidase/D-alanyl-D-alanine-endopeptidase [Planctomyces sp.]
MIVTGGWGGGYGAGARSRRSGGAGEMTTDRVWRVAACWPVAWCHGGVLAVGLALVVALGAPAAAHGQGLEGVVERAVRGARLGGAEVAVSVRDARTGEALASMNSRQGMVPASNMKLLTSGAALVVLGAEYKFRTRMFVDGSRLVVVGSGDPAFADPELLRLSGRSLEEFMGELVEPFVRAGVKGLREVVIDDRVFDREMVHPGWPRDQLDKWYAAPVSGLNFHANVMEVFVAVGPAVGSAPRVRKVPDAAWLELDNSARTVGRGGASALGVQRLLAGGLSTAAGARYRLFGELSVTQVEPIQTALAEPSLVFGQLLADRLGAAGLGQGQGGGIVARLAEPGEMFSPGAALVEVVTPLAEVLARCNIDSYNLYAEALLKRLGREVTGQPGSWDNGAAVVRMTVTERTGAELSQLVVTDGSGLSAENRVSAGVLTSWLASLYRDAAVRGAMVESLAEPGEGTLRKRFKDRRVPGGVHAKSGYINGVQCLSGYVIGERNGRAAAFSVLVNQTQRVREGGAVKKFHEDVVEAVARWLDEQPPRTEEPDDGRGQADARR